MAVTSRFLARTLVLMALLALAGTAHAGTAAECSICATDCYTTYSDNVDDCSWRVWCQHLAGAERDACINACITDRSCDDYDWFPRPGEEGSDDFWSNWLI